MDTQRDFADFKYLSLILRSAISTTTMLKAELRGLRATNQGGIREGKRTRHDVEKPHGVGHLTSSWAAALQGLQGAGIDPCVLLGCID